MGFLQMRKAAGLTQALAAKIIGVTEASVCMWETGKTLPRAALLPKVAEAYGCSIEDLYRDDCEEETN